MKNIITLLVLTLIMTTSCVSKKSAERIKEEKDSIAQELTIKDSLINDIFVSMSGIVDNLSVIKSRENIITGNISGGEIPRQYTTTISQDIQAIDQLLIKNKQEIASLQASLKKLSASNFKVESMEKLISQLQDEVAQKDTQVTELKNRLSTMNVKMNELNVQVAELQDTVKVLNSVNAGLSGEIKIQEELLNSCYYIVGVEKELINRKIVYKSGFIGRTLKVNENHSLETYTKINMSTVDKIHVGHSKVEIVTSHPAESYQFVIGKGEIVESIEILDKDKFWATSKILIVSYK